MAIGTYTRYPATGGGSGGITQLTGDVTAGPGSGSQAATIANNVVTNAKLAQMAAHTIKGNSTAGLANASDLTATQVTALLNVFTSTLNGLAPLSGGGTTNFLRADGTWAAPTGSGTVTTVSVVTANGVSGSVANPTTTPAITLTLGAITPSSVAASGTVTGSNLSGTNTGDQTITLTGDVTGSGTGSFAATIAAAAVTNAKIANTTIDLTAKVTGILPVANGGTNASAALSNNRVMQSTGGTIVEAAAITASRALQSDANGIPTQSATTATELGYVSGVRDSIQDQFTDNTAVSSSPYTVLATDYKLQVDTTAARTLNLPNPATEAVLNVKDTTGTADANNITLHRFGAETIEGLAADYVMQTRFGTTTLYSDGTNWWFI